MVKQTLIKILLGLKSIADRWGINEEFDFEINPDWGEHLVELGDIVDFID